MTQPSDALTQQITEFAARERILGRDLDDAHQEARRVQEETRRVHIEARRLDDEARRLDETIQHLEAELAVTQARLDELYTASEQAEPSP